MDLVERINDAAPEYGDLLVAVPVERPHPIARVVLFLNRPVASAAAVGQCCPPVPRFADPRPPVDDVRVIYGADEFASEALVDKTVASVRRSLAGPFGISSQALPYIRGHEIGEVYRLQSSDVLEFLVRWGWKGAFTKFSTILADPPWPYRSSGAIVGNGGRGNPHGRAKDTIQVDVKAHYPTMPIEAIKSLPVKNFAAANAHLYLWTTNAFLDEAHDVARAWGFKPKTILTWVKMKNSKEVEVSMKTGYWYRSATEHIIFGVRGKQRLLGPAVPTAYLLPRPRRHSEKPVFFYDLIEQQSPGPYLELFARRLRRGWDSWGNEIVSTLKLPGMVG